MTAATTVQAATQGVPLPAIPVVDRSLTAGQDPAVLLAHAIALLGAGAQAAPLQTSLSGLQANVTGDTVTAAQASAAATAADERAGKAAQAANQLDAGASSLDGALRSATLSLYMSGQPTGVPDMAAGNGDAVMAAMIGEQVALSPSGILAKRRTRRGERSTGRHRRQGRTGGGRRRRGPRRAGHRRRRRPGHRHAERAFDAQRSHRPHPADRVRHHLPAGRAEGGRRVLVGSSRPPRPLPAPVATSSVALTWLFSELGKTYVYGATGPTTFDCSGLTQFVWNKAGVSIPRVAIDQDSYAVPVPLSDLRPGDLVFFGADVHHVGMYVGDGLMINAPHTGECGPGLVYLVVRPGRLRSGPLARNFPSRPRPRLRPPPPRRVQLQPGAVPSQTAPPPASRR